MIDFEQIGKYKITARIGQGSFGVVYRGRDAYLKRDVAIKICSVEDEGLRQRFFREAEIAGKLQHRNIVTVYEFGFEGKIPYLVQELLSGEDLSKIIKSRRPLPAVDKLDALLGVGSGLDYAHAAGVVHRDIKPANVRVLEDGGVKIMDFGIAKLANAETQLTQKGVTMGTASYLPPEQVRGADLDHRADVFSFGVLAYELMSGVRPFRGNTLSALVYQILYKVPPPMVSVWPACPEALSRLVGRCLEKRPDRRFASFAELLPELETLREEVAAGRWPELDAPVAAAADDADEAESDGDASRTGETVAGESREPSSAVSPAKVAESARLAAEGKVGEYTISTAAPAAEVLRPPAAGSDTRPVTKPPAETGGDELHKTHVMATEEMTMPGRRADDPALEAAPAAAVDLASEAQEISRLVAEGRLAAAKEKLEQTLSGEAGAPPDAAAPPTWAQPSPPSETDAAPPAGAPVPAAPVPAAPVPAAPVPAAPVPAAPDALRPSSAVTQPIPTVPPPAPDAAAPPAAGVKTRPGTLPPTWALPTPEAPPPRGRTVPLAAPPPARPSAPPAGSDTYRTAIGLPFDRLKWIGLAAGVVLVAGIVWLAMRGAGGTDERAPAETAAPVETPAPETTAAAGPPTGTLLVHGIPWVEVTEITDADGYLAELPESRYTPLHLELPAGSYRVELRHPAREALETCEVEVGPAAVARCEPEPGAVDVTDYFKASGWWR